MQTLQEAAQQPLDELPCDEFTRRVPVRLTIDVDTFVLLLPPAERAIWDGARSGRLRYATDPNISRRIGFVWAKLHYYVGEGALRRFDRRLRRLGKHPQPLQQPYRLRKGMELEPFLVYVPPDAVRKLGFTPFTGTIRRHARDSAIRRRWYP